MNGNSYVSLKKTGAVEIRFPKKAEFVSAHTFQNADGEEVCLPDHHTSRLCVQGGREVKYILRHFYGCSDEDRGKTILVIIEIAKKTVGRMGDKPFIILNIHKIHDPTVSPEGSVTFFTDGKGFSVIPPEGSDEDPLDYRFLNI